MGLTSERAIGTIVSGHQFGRALALISSIQKTDPDQDLSFHVLVVDRDEDFFRVPFPNCKTYFLKDLSRTRAYLHPMAFLYSLPRICSVLRPVFMQHLLNQGHAENVIYFDSHVHVYSPLKEIFELLRTHPAILVPQVLTHSMRRGSRPSDKDILVSGAFSGDFLAVGRKPAGLAFLSWWAKHLEDQFFSAIDGTDFHRDSEESFPDQRWLDFVPALFPEIRLLRSKSYNVGSWNLHERPLAWKRGRFWVENEPLISFNFRDLDVNQELSPTVRRLCLDYSESLHRAGDPIFSGLNSPFEHWDNGVRIPDLARRMLPKAKHEDCFFDPRSTASPKSYFSWLTGREGDCLPRLLLEIWNLREDVRCFFPDPHGRDRVRLLQWAVDFGVREMDLDPHLAVAFAEQGAYRTPSLLT